MTTSPANLAVRLLYRAGPTRWLARRALSSGRFVLMLHGISSAHRSSLPITAQPYLDAGDLAGILGWLEVRSEFLTVDEFLEGARPGVLLTFDDGYANNHTQALPMLRQQGAPAVFFVTTRHVTDPRDWLPSIREEVINAWGSPAEVPEAVANDLYDGLSIAQLRECAAADGLQIGSHSVSHPLLSSLDLSVLEHEIHTSKRQLEDWTDRPVRLFAYPTGDYDRPVALAVHQAGYRAAFAVDRLNVAANRDFEIPRIGLYRSEPWYLAAKLCGLHRSPLPVGHGT